MPPLDLRCLADRPDPLRRLSHRPHGNAVIYLERNTFQFYQCKEGQPDFAYSIQRAFQDEFLVPYKFASGTTVILAEGAKVDEETYDPAEFELAWTNEDSNRKMMQEFDRLAWESYRELAPGQRIGPGKAIAPHPRGIPRSSFARPWPWSARS